MSKHHASEGEYVLPLRVERLPEGIYLATSNDLPALLAQGTTLDETIEIARDVARKLIESHIEHGDPIPASLKQGSGLLEVDTAFAVERGRLSGFGYNEIARRLRICGFELDRRASSCRRHTRGNGPRHSEAS